MRCAICALRILRLLSSLYNENSRWNSFQFLKRNLMIVLNIVFLHCSQIPGATNLDPRSWATKLTRLQIGHTPLTHSYLITRDPLPYCNDYLVPLTIKHLLIECPSHNHHWYLFGCPSPPTMPNVFRPANCIFGCPLQAFIRNVGFLQSIWSTNHLP